MLRTVKTRFTEADFCSCYTTTGPMLQNTKW